MAENEPREPDADDEDESKKPGFGRKLLGFFVEAEAPRDGPADDIDEEVTAIGKVVVRPPPASTSPVASVAAPAPRDPGGQPRPPPPPSYKTPDFGGIFKSVGMADEERDRLAKAEELLRNLPAETPVAVKRQIVEGTLKAFGHSPEKISGAATRAIEALDTYAGIGEQDLRTRIDTTEKRLKELRAEEARLSAALAERQAMQQVLVWDVRARQAELESVIAFFGGKPPSPKS